MPEINIDTNYRWTKRPEIKLFNLIPVSVSSKVDPLMKRKLTELESSLPDILSKNDFKQKIAKVWLEIQEPKLIDSQTQTYASFQPTQIGLSEINSTNNIMRLNFQIKGFPKIKIGDKLAISTTEPLPDLEKISASASSIKITLPIIASYKDLERISNKRLSNIGLQNLEKQFGGDLEVKNVKLSAEANKLTLAVDLVFDHHGGWLSKLDVFGWFDIKGTAYFHVVPILNSKNMDISISELTLDSNTYNMLADILVDIANHTVLKKSLADSLKYDYSNKSDEYKEIVNSFLNRNVSDMISISGKIETLNFDNLDINKEALVIDALMQGQSELRYGL